MMMMMFVAVEREYWREYMVCLLFAVEMRAEARESKRWREREKNANSNSTF